MGQKEYSATLGTELLERRMFRRRRYRSHVPRWCSARGLYRSNRRRWGADADWVRGMHEIAILRAVLDAITLAPFAMIDDFDEDYDCGYLKEDDYRFTRIAKEALDGWRGSAGATLEA